MNTSDILTFVLANSKHPMKIKELARGLGIPQDSYPAFRTKVKELLRRGLLVTLSGGRVGLPRPEQLIEGKLQITRSGQGFLLREGDGMDILLSPHATGNALDGDTISVRLTGKINGRETGEVVRVVSRAPRNIVGIFTHTRQDSYVTPDNPRIHRKLQIPHAKKLKARNGDKVVAKLVSWDDPQRDPEGEIAEVLGKPTDPGVDMLAIARSFDLPDSFPPDVLDQAERASALLTSSDKSGRIDLTNECVYTIDPHDAKDHDDAISVKKTPHGYTLGVHIADVSAYVTEGTALDSEALRRGTSVYLPGMVIPMLPEVLSNDVCSLRPHRHRLAHTVHIRFDGEGKMLDWELSDTLIDSKAKLSYEDVQEFFDTGVSNAAPPEVAKNLLLARELAKLLTARRFAEGSLDFDLPEAQIILNENGDVLDLGHKVRLESHRLIEEFMLAANRAVALHVFRLAQPFIYRVHDRPAMETISAFAEMMEHLGHSFAVTPDIRPIQFARFLKKIEDLPEADFINEVMLRSMKKAVYQRQNIGHFGLAFTHYTHFTSPIRRYPDLLVHRLVRLLSKGHYPANTAKRITGDIDRIARHCSEAERHAESAERQAIKVKQAQFMAGHIGKEFDGTVSGVMPYGIFVRIKRMGVEGLVRVGSMDGDYYVHDEARHKLVGRRSKKSFRLGDVVRVGVLAVDTLKSEIDLYLVGEKTERTEGTTTDRVKRQLLHAERVKKRKFPIAVKRKPKQRPRKKK